MPEGGISVREVIRADYCRNLGVVLMILIAVTAAGCTTTATVSQEPASPTPIGRSTEQLLRDEIRLWLGTPHRMGGMTRRGIDCSGLVISLYNDLFHVQLPRTARDMMRSGRRVDKTALTAGDLVFFRPATKYHHVGIYLGRGEFVHTSTSKGVMISRVDDDFWSRCYLTGRRLL